MDKLKLVVLCDVKNIMRAREQESERKREKTVREREREIRKNFWSLQNSCLGEELNPRLRLTGTAPYTTRPPRYSSCDR